MKRLLAIVFALIMGLAWTLPSLAVEFSGQYRLRGEYRDNADFTDDTVDGRAFYGQRIRLTAKANPTDDVKVKVTIQDTREWGEFSNVGPAATNGGPRLTEVNSSASEHNYELDIHEGWLQIDNIFGSPLAVRVGRQELVYGDQRLIGAFGWSNNGRSFDAMKFMYRSDAFDVDAWTSKVVERGTNNDQDFYGVYATVKTIPNHTLDLYVLLLNDGSGQATFNNTGTIAGVNDTNLWTYGFRLKGSTSGVDYTIEVPFQTGDMEVTGGSDYDISAYAYAINVGYTIPGAPMGLRIGGQYIFASGDDNSSDTDIDTFSNLYPTNHMHYGYADQQGWRNVKAWNLNAIAQVTPKTSVKLDYWDFALDEEADCWYGAGNWMNSACAGVRNANANWDDKVGSEVDITVKHKYNSAVAFQFGYSRFFAGDRLDDALGTGVDADDMDWAYFQVLGNY